MTVLTSGKTTKKTQSGNKDEKEKGKSKTPPEKQPKPEPIYATVVPKSKRTGKKDGAGKLSQGWCFSRHAIILIFFLQVTARAAQVGSAKRIVQQCDWKGGRGGQTGRRE